jgi:hypothetical protein
MSKPVPPEDETFELVFGSSRNTNARAGLAHASTAAGVDLASEPEEGAPLCIDDITSETLREALLGAVALAHGRVLSGKFGTAPGEQAGLEKLMQLIQQFPDLAKAVDSIQDYRRPAQLRAAEAVNARSATVSETVQRLRVVLGKK